MKTSITGFISLLLLLVLTGCPSPVGDQGTGSSESDACDITRFVFTATTNPTLAGEVSGSIGTNTVSVEVPSGTATTAMVATYETSSGATVYVGGIAQESGVTANDFSDTVLYSVVAEDGTTKIYSILITATTAPVTISTSGPTDSVGFTTTFTQEDLNFSFKYCPSGTFPTGTGDLGTGSIAAPFLVGETEVTYELWEAVYSWATAGSGSLGAGEYTFANPGIQGGIIYETPTGTDQHPVTKISWRDSMIFCNALTEYYNAHKDSGSDLSCYYTSDASYSVPIRTSTSDLPTFVGSTPAGSEDAPYVNPDGTGFRLLTENEWICAARYLGPSDPGYGLSEGGLYWTPGTHASGSDVPYDTTDDAINVSLTDVAVNGGRSSTTAAVGSKLPNYLGCYDMSGNVSEYLFDLTSTSGIVSRQKAGGNYYSLVGYCQVGDMNSSDPYSRYSFNGLRIAMDSQ